MTIIFLNLQIRSTRPDIRPHIKWALGLVAYGHFNLPRGFVWVCMGKHTQSITLEGLIGFKILLSFCCLLLAYM